MLRRLGPSGPFDTASTANLASLAALGARDATGGDVVWVQSLRRPFVKDPVPGGGAPGQVVACVDGSGAWRSLPGFSSPASAWVSQTEWHIDAIGGNVEGLGTAASPIDSWRELCARVARQQLPAGCTINIHSDLSEEIDWTELIPHPSGLLISGERGATTALEATVATFAPETVVAPGEAPLLTSAAVADWTPLVGYRIRFIDGPAAEALSSIATADPNGSGINIARLPQPVSPVLFAGPTTYPSPVAGNTFRLERLPVVRGLRPAAAGSGIPQQLVVVRGIALPDVVYPDLVTLTGGELNLIGCTMGDNVFSMARANLQGCRLGSPLGLTTNFFSGWTNLWGSTLYNGGLYGPGSDMIHNVYQGGLWLFGGGHMLHHCGCFDGFGSGLMIARSGTFATLFGVLYGTGNAAYGVEVPSGFSGASYNVKPVVTGTTADAFVTGTGGAWALVPFFDTNTGAGIVTP